MPNELTCSFAKNCAKPAAYGVSLSGERYRPACFEHAIFAAVPLAALQTVELAPVDWAFGDDAPPG